MNKDTQYLAWVNAIVQQCQQEKMYGEVIIKMEAGTIVFIQKRVSLKPPKD